MFKTRNILLFIMVIASFFRFFRITSSPAALNWDEVSIGYNAYSILETGKDEWGKTLPLAFKAFGEIKLPGMIYASIPGIAIFGLTDFGVRVTPALIGVITVYALYILVSKLFHSEKYGLAAAALLAISPWHVHFSRVSFEAGLALLLTILSLYNLLRAKDNPRYYWHAGFLAVLAAYTYNSIRIILPLLFVAYLINGTISFTSKTKSTLIKVILVALILCIPIFRELRSSEGRVRWGALSIASQKSFVDGIAESRGYTTLPSLLPRLIHNKATHYVYDFFMNYISTFSTEFLYFHGSTNTQRSVQGMGLFYLFELPLLIIGITALLRSKDKKMQTASKILLPLLLLAPIPSALTTDAPSSVRTISILIPFLAIESLGLLAVLNELSNRSRIVKIVALGFTFWCISYFAYQLWFVYPVRFAEDWAYGYKQAVSWAANQEDVDNVFFTSQFGEPYIYTLFYGKIDPAYYQGVTKNYSIDPLGWVHIQGFGKYHFTDFYGLESPTEIVARNPGSNLLVAPFAVLPGNVPRDLEIKAPTWRVMFEGVVVEGETQ